MVSKVRTTHGEQVWPVVVIGAGAAGLMAAIFAARGGVPVLVVETRPRPGAKIRLSGGGRCNLLPSSVAPGDFHTSGSVHSLRQVLRSWPLEAAHAFFEHDLGIPLKTEPSGKVFPRSDDAAEVLEALLRECARAGARMRAPFRVVSVRPPAREPGSAFALQAAGGEQLHGHRVVLASGGLSYPRTGSDGTGMTIALSLGHNLAATYPALVPLIGGEAGWRELRGVSVRVRLSVKRRGRTVERREGDLLFTHRGFSGPVVLDLSHHFTRPERARPEGAGSGAAHPEAPGSGGARSAGDGVDLFVRWGGSEVASWDDLLRSGGRRSVGTVVSQYLPRRLASVLLRHAGLDRQHRLSELSRDGRKRLVALLEEFPLPVTGSEGYRKAEVTGGGIPLAEVVTKTLESRLVPGLFFCGEILDVIGRLGGYNFYWAWVSGRKVGEAVAAMHADHRESGMSYQ